MSNQEEHFEIHLAFRWISTLSRAMGRTIEIEFQSQNSVRIFGVMMLNMWNIAHPGYVAELKSIAVRQTGQLEP
jgi:hypothetical protein